MLDFTSNNTTATTKLHYRNTGANLRDSERGFETQSKRTRFRGDVVAEVIQKPSQNACQSKTLQSGSRLLIQKRLLMGSLYSREGAHMDHPWSMGLAIHREVCKRIQLYSFVRRPKESGSNS
jgi:hypothetical protein